MEIALACIALLGIAFVIALIQIVRYEKELRRMAQFLEEQEEVSNARLTADVHSKGVLRLGKALNRQLDIRQQSEQLMHAKDRELRDGFAYLSHDIRTPLMGARGYLQLALEEEETSEAHRYISQVNERLGMLQTILDQLFLFTRVSNVDYPVECSEVVLSEAVSEVVVSFYPEFEARGWEPRIALEDNLDTGGDEQYTKDASRAHASVVWADPDALSRIIENLTSNMLRHGAGEPAIVQEAETLTFSNRIAHPELLETELLFERFYKGGESENAQGSGLGLAIVAELAEAMGAQVDAQVSLESDKAYLSISISFPENFNTSLTFV